MRAFCESLRYFGKSTMKRTIKLPRTLGVLESGMPSPGMVLW